MPYPLLATIPGEPGSEDEWPSDAAGADSGVCLPGDTVVAPVAETDSTEQCALELVFAPMTEFLCGQHVYVELEGQKLDAIFVCARQEGAVRPDPVAESADTAWVRREDTGEVEPVAFEALSPA